MITKKTAQKICSHWHGGQWSAYYQFLSSGIFTVENCLRYLQETEDNLHPEYAPYPCELNKGELKELTALKEYFLNEAKKNGVEIVYHPHPIYGYSIPFVENNPENIENITTLRYPI